MARSTLLPIKATDIEIDIYSNKSSMLLFWLLTHIDDVQARGFSINEMARYSEISVGLAYKVIKQLEYIGIIKSKGLRTNKKFYLENPDKLLVSWVKEYSLIKKTKLKGFSLEEVNLKFDSFHSSLIPALHSASSLFFKTKITNLRVQEFYLLDWKKLPQITKGLRLHELDRGYELLLIKPYYSSLLEKFSDKARKEEWFKAYALLTILDLCHFPLRGIEQAEALFKSSPFLKSICPWREIENAVG